jgi:hypothetical protein
MRGTKQTLGLLMAIIMAALAAVGQSKVPPPPKPADEGPSLADTMQFIQSKLSNLGTVSWVDLRHNSKNGSDVRESIVHELSGVTADAAACSVKVQRKVTSDASGASERDITFPLKLVENISVMPKDQHSNRWFAEHGQPEMTASVSPNVSVMLVHFSDKRQDEFLAFFEEELANRLAKATVHAVELCGGGGKAEPF